MVCRLRRAQSSRAKPTVWKPDDNIRGQGGREYPISNPMRNHRDKQGMSKLKVDSWLAIGVEGRLRRNDSGASPCRRRLNELKIRFLHFGRIGPAPNNPAASYASLLLAAGHGGRCLSFDCTQALRLPPSAENSEIPLGQNLR